MIEPVSLYSLYCLIVAKTCATQVPNFPLVVNIKLAFMSVKYDSGISISVG